MRKLFFTLLRAGLWQHTADANLFTDLQPADWERLFYMARSQAVAALVFDGVATLPAAVRPPRTLYVQWAGLALQIERENCTLDAAIPRLFEPYRAAGLHPVLLKGQGVARCYPNPARRTSGDIDIYVGKKGIDTANNLLLAMGAVHTSEESDKHSGFSLDGVEIENHRLLAQMNAPRANRYLARMIRAWYPDNTDEVDIDGYVVHTPPATFNAFYIFQHIFQHILTGGIGLRQVCDWACVLHAYCAAIDSVQLALIFKKTGLLKAARALGYVAVHHLGLPSQCLPFTVDDMHREGERLLDDIFATGNFGQYDEAWRLRPKGYWKGKWHTMMRTWSRRSIMNTLAPAETRWSIVMLLRKNIYIQLKRLK
ncbi:MAG: nucleotidyltransferase family protein [Prevotellaceae bacterium]|nr:nucleotidyltransferase family protein [Prevotellaceae bacterium]